MIYAYAFTLLNDWNKRLFYEDEKFWYALFDEDRLNIYRRLSCQCYTSLELIVSVKYRRNARTKITTKVRWQPRNGYIFAKFPSGRKYIERRMLQQSGTRAFTIHIGQLKYTKKQISKTNMLMLSSTTGSCPMKVKKHYKTRGKRKFKAPTSNANLELYYKVWRRWHFLCLILLSNRIWPRVESDDRFGAAENK